MKDTVTKDNSAVDSGTDTIKVAFLSYSQTESFNIEELLQTVDLKGVEVLRVSMSNQKKLVCDMAVALLENIDQLEEYKHDIASLKIVRKIPLVIAVVPEADKTVIEENRAEITADDICFMPIKASMFEKKIKTHVVALKIARQNDKHRIDYSRKAISLGEILVENDLINPLQLKKALEYQRGTGLKLGDALVQLGYIDEDQKTQFLAGQLNVPLAISRQYAAADLNVVSLIPEHVARRYHCLALEKNENELVVSMTDVLNLHLLDSLRDLTDLSIKPVLGKLDDINVSIERFYRDIASHKDASNLISDLSDSVEYVQDTEGEDDLEDVAAAGAELGIIKLVNMLISNAVRDKASDIHIEPMEKELFVRYRIDGDLRKIMSPPKRSHQAIITRIKILSNLDIAERRLPQDGRMVVKMGLREVDIRVSILPSVFGEKAVLRILDKEAFEKSVMNLGFTSYDEGIFKSQIAKPYGMVIVTGPTGSGKSTTLYSAIQTVKNVTRNIITVEDPVEFHMDGVTQVHVNTRIGLTFGTALRSILRQDPDVVLIGEIRDDETADIAIKMALTGHLVFSTLHTNDAASSIARFIDIGIPPLLLGSSLNLIVAQRLVRKICTKCKVEYTPDDELLEQLNIDPAKKPRFFKGAGCVACNGTGYSGRTAIFELLAISREIRKMILRNASTIEIQDQAEKDGMKTLRKAGIEMALRGETTVEQVIAVTTEI